MGPWEIVGGLAAGGTVVLAEGVPDYPAPDRLWSMVERHRVTILGVSPTLDPCADQARRRAGAVARPEPAAHPGLDRRAVGPRDLAVAVREAAAGRLPIINITGGTEVGACLLSAFPTTPLKPCSLVGPSLGMAVDVVRRGRQSRWDPAGGRRAGLHQALAGDDAGDLGRPRALPGDLLVAMAGRLGPRRLGVDRRGRRLVPPRPQRRHAQGGRQAAGAGRGRVDPRPTRPSPSRPPSGVPHPVKGEADLVRGGPYVLASTPPTSWRRGPARRVGARARLGRSFTPARWSSRPPCQRREAPRSCDARYGRRHR